MLLHSAELFANCLSGKKAVWKNEQKKRESKMCSLCHGWYLRLRKNGGNKTDQLLLSVEYIYCASVCCLLPFLFPFQT